MGWDKPQMRKWLALRGFRVLRTWPSGRVRIQYGKTICDCASTEKAFNLVNEWIDVKVKRFTARRGE